MRSTERLPQCPMKCRAFFLLDYLSVLEFNFNKQNEHFFKKKTFFHFLIVHEHLSVFCTVPTLGRGNEGIMFFPFPLKSPYKGSSPYTGGAAATPRSECV